MAYLSSFLWLGGNPTRWKSMFMSSSTAVRCLSTLQCWSCKATCGTVFCPLCRVPQPTTPRLNYYELLVPEKARTPSSKGIHFWRLSLNKLHHEFISLQRLIHPDVFAHHEDTKTKSFCLEQSSIINKAYRTLKNELQRAFYLLEFYGVPITDHSDSSNEKTDPAFLMFIFESQEQLEDQASTKEDLTQLKEIVERMCDCCLV
ncbi:hypothetical protein HMI54_005489 [Coelomomyces lativittatus]|nr:hypothetical protein HMI54_005489 [Coelomomyces lativittatus]